LGMGNLSMRDSRLEPVEWELAPTLMCLGNGSGMGNYSADVAQLVERELPKLEVAGSRPVVRFFPLCRAKIPEVV
jgi:hypothetical protein